MDENALKDLPIQSENLGFKSEEMLPCPKCRRTNPPTRMACLYCGAELELKEEQLKNLRPNLRKLEIWEKGFNLVLLPNGQSIAEDRKKEIGKLLNLESEVLGKIFDGGNALPLARVGSEKEADLVRERLFDFGVNTFVLSDEKLESEKPPTRLRGLEFFDDKLALIFFNEDKVVKTALDDICLIVTGAIFERKLQATEERNKKGDNKILQTTETASDNFLIDIYSRNDPNGFRIFAKGFDFSCLGEEKEILASDNLKKLVRKLSEIPNAKLIEDYFRIRESLGHVWDVEERKDSKGLQRERFGRFNLENVTTVNNAEQFTKYSRLQWHLL